MEKVIGNKKAKLWFMCAVILAVVQIYISSVVSSSLLQGHVMLIFFGTMAIMMISY